MVAEICTYMTKCTVQLNVKIARLVNTSFVYVLRDRKAEILDSLAFYLESIKIQSITHLNTICEEIGTSIKLEASNLKTLLGNQVSIYENICSINWKHFHVNVIRHFRSFAFLYLMES